jgi:Histidine kinase-, DNA gyrase B-, and HSP90-like ATPase
VHGQALRLAADQAALQSNVSSMFVNLSRRSQGLVERQLQLIEQLESNEQDPDQLSNLFQLDHLATRMRRNSENLLVLAGTDFSKRNVAPVPLVDVLRAAVSEIEHYQRIVVQAPPQVTVVGRATSDIVHLLAELLDNATNFSPPESQVVMSSMRTPDGSILVEIADSGVGMLEQELTDANRRLTTPSAVDVSASRRMGLFVVGRLGARHGITVHLGGAPMGGPGGGLTASVTLPAHLVVAGDEAGRQPRGDDALVGAGSPNGVPPQRAGQLGRPAPRPMLAAPANGQQLPQPAGLNGLPTRTPGSSLRREPLVAQSAPDVADPATTEQPVARTNGVADRGVRPNAWANGNGGDGRSRAGTPDAPAGDADPTAAGATTGAEAHEQGADVTPRNGTPADGQRDVFDSGHWDMSQWDADRSADGATDDQENAAADAGTEADDRSDVVEGAEAAETADTEADPAEKSAEQAAPGPDGAGPTPAGRPAAPRPRPSPGPNGSHRDKPLPSTPYRAAADGPDRDGVPPNGAGRNGVDHNGVDRNGGFAPPTTPLPVVADDADTPRPSTAPAASAPEATDPADALFSASVPAISELEGPPRGRRPLAELRRSPVDVTETTPIFAEIASAWFASQRPVPVDWELGHRPGESPADQAPAGAPPGLSGPIGDPERPQAPVGRAPADPAAGAVAPARPGPARPSAPQAPEPAEQAFATVADEGWRAASGAAAERPDELTAAGLPKRRPRARLVPGSAGSAVLAAPASPTRSAESIRGRLASYQQGVRQGRETRLRRDPGGTGPQPAVPGENATAPAGGEHDEENR